VSTPYRSFTEPAQAARQIKDLSAATAILDVEPLIAHWDTSQAVLDDGLTAILNQLAAAPGPLRQIVFATNSARRPSTRPDIDGLQIRYLAPAGKPLRTAHHQDLPTPAVAVERPDRHRRHPGLAAGLHLPALHPKHDQNPSRTTRHERPQPTTTYNPVPQILTIALLYASGSVG
jgi:hypothetical protein